MSEKMFNFNNNNYDDQNKIDFVHFRRSYRRRQWHSTPVLLPGKSHGWRSLVGCHLWGHTESDTTERLHFHSHALEKEMATHSSVLAWRIPGMREPGGLPSMGSHRVGHDWSDLAAAASYASPKIFLFTNYLTTFASASGLGSPLTSRTNYLRKRPASCGQHLFL